MKDYDKSLTVGALKKMLELFPEDYPVAINGDILPKNTSFFKREEYYTNDENEPTLYEKYIDIYVIYV